MLSKINNFFKSIICLLTLVSFLGTTTITTYAQSLRLPAPNQFIPLSNTYSLPILKGIKINPENPFDVEFIIDSADTDQIKKEEATRLIMYFLAALTIPKEDIWVNLSPYEQDRVVSGNLALTDLGKDLLSQDYVLKQLTASVTYPESKVGADFWAKTYKEVLEVARTTNLPINTFNKIWIMPDKSEVYENGNLGFITKASLKVMLEEDYLAMNNAKDQNQGLRGNSQALAKKINEASSKIMRQVVLPKINQDVNNGKNFATLRQVYNSIVLGLWFKEKFKESAYKHYINQNKIKGIDIKDKQAIEKIYTQYVEAFKQGLYDYIKPTYDPGSRKMLKRRYYSGGFTLASSTISTRKTLPQGVHSLAELVSGRPFKVNGKTLVETVENIWSEVDASKSQSPKAGSSSAISINDLKIAVNEQRLFYSLSDNRKFPRNSHGREAFYAAVLGDVGKKVVVTGKGLEVEMAKGDRFKRFLEKESYSVGDIGVEKIYQGEDNFFQMGYKIDGQELLLTFKRSTNPETDGYSVLVQPRMRIIINGYGVIGKKVADLLRKSGYEIIAAVNTGRLSADGKAKQLTHDAIYKGYPLFTAFGAEKYLTSAREAYLPYQGSITDLLEQLRKDGKTAIVVDASTGGKGDKETRTGWLNREQLYKPYDDVIKAVVYQGGESPEVADAAFSLDTADWSELNGLFGVQIVSCNTTGMNRTYSALRQALLEAGIDAKIVIDNNALRREGDPGAEKPGKTDEVQLNGSNTALSKQIETSLNIGGANVDTVTTSAKGFYVHIATLRSDLSIEELKERLFSDRAAYLERLDQDIPISHIQIIQDKSSKFETSNLYKQVFESSSHSPEEVMVVNVMPSDIPGEIKVVFGYSMDIKVPNKTDPAVYGINALFAPLRNRLDVYLDNLAYIPGGNLGSQLGGISVVPKYHHGDDLKQTFRDVDSAVLGAVNTPASMVPSTHYHVHVATIKSKGLTAPMVRGALKQHSRMALVDFPNGIFSSALLFEVINSGIGEEVIGGSHPMVIISQVKESHIPGEIKVIYAVPQESDVVPENANAVHAILGTFSKGESRRIVDEILQLDRIKQGIEVRLPVVENLIVTSGETKKAQTAASSGINSEASRTITEKASRPWQTGGIDLQSTVAKTAPGSTSLSFNLTDFDLANFSGLKFKVTKVEQITVGELDSF